MGVKAKSAMDKTVFKEGTKYGGSAILWAPNLKENVVPVECQSNRYLLNNVTLLILNAYIPCDHKVHDHHYDEMEEVLREVQQIMLDYDASYTIFGGDLNTDISRNIPHTHSLVEFINEYDLTFCTELEYADVHARYLYV